MENSHFHRVENASLVFLGYIFRYTFLLGREVISFEAEKLQVQWRGGVALRNEPFTRVNDQRNQQVNSRSRKRVARDAPPINASLRTLLLLAAVSWSVRFVKTRET